jgi:exosortase/archaeosortase family protein
VFYSFQFISNFLANIAAIGSGFLLKLSFESVKIKTGIIPSIGVNDFAVTIFYGCEGTQSLILFIFLYLLASAMEWNSINKKRFALSLLIGSISMILLNILRIYFIMLSGIFISKNFAIKTVHPITALIFFIIFFTVYWKISFKYLKRK